MPTPDPTVLWNAASPVKTQFDPASIASLPEPARRYLNHSILAGAPVAQAVRLSMRGELKVGGRWYPFKAEQVTRAERGFVWRARLKMKGLPVSGADYWLDGDAALSWKLLGLFRLVHATGPEIARSALGRMQAEAIWLPTSLLAPGVRWHVNGGLEAVFDTEGRRAHLHLKVDEHGRPLSLRTKRWGKPDNEPFGEYDFGGEFLEEGTFQGITIPTRVSIGWFYGSKRYEEEGEFFRAEVEHAEFR
jgi:hypothetical protein